MPLKSSSKTFTVTLLDGRIIEDHLLFAHRVKTNIQPKIVTYHNNPLGIVGVIDPPTDGQFDAIMSILRSARVCSTQWESHTDRLASRCQQLTARLYSRANSLHLSAQYRSL